MLIKVNGINLYYETVGKGTPLLLLHGNGEDSSIFDQIMEPLSQKYQVFALDSRAHGQSEKTTELSYQAMTEDTAAFCRILELKKPVLYGFSDGGIIGLMVAAQYPDLLSRLVISGANTTPDGLKAWFRWICRVGYFFHPQPRVKMMLTQPHITKRELENIQIPTLILAGQHDIIRREHTQAIADAIPNGTVKIVRGEEHGSYVIHSRKLLAYL